MIKENPAIKPVITLQDKVSAIAQICSAHFTPLEDGIIDFTPEYSEFAEVNAIVLNFLTGITFDTDEKGVITENIYECVLADEELTRIVRLFYDKSLHNEEAYSIMSYVLNCAARKIDYLQKKNIAASLNSGTALLMDKVMSILEKEKQQMELAVKNRELEQEMIKKQSQWYDYQNQAAEYISPEEQALFTRKMAESDFDLAKVSEIMAEKFCGSGLNQKNEEIAQAVRTIKQQEELISRLQDDFAKLQERRLL